MAICTISNGVSRGCRDSAGGAYTFFIANYPSGTTTSAEFLTKDVDGKVTDFTGTTVAVAVPFYEFTPNKNSGEFTETYEVSLENGTRGYAQMAKFSLSKIDQDKQNLVDQLATGNFLVVVKDRNSNFFLMGENDAAVLTGGNSGTGLELTNMNGYAIEMGSSEGKPAAQVDASAITLA